jgi:hypothetical protein
MTATGANYSLSASPSGGTLATVFTLFDNFTIEEVVESHRPFALSPISHDSPTAVARSWLSEMTGVIRHPNLGLLTSSLAGRTDAAIVERTWGLLYAIPSRREKEFYGPNFTYREYMRARSRIQGTMWHFGMQLFGLMLLVSPLRRLVHRFVMQPGNGPEKVQAKQDKIEYRGIGTPDAEKPTSKAYCTLKFAGSMYLCKTDNACPVPGIR